MSGTMIYLARRNPALTREQFPDRWIRHTRVGGVPQALEEMRRVTYCLVQPGADVLPYTSDEYDGVALVELTSLSSIRLIHELSTTYDVALADELRVFSTFTREFKMFGSPRVLRDGPTGEAAVIQFVRREREVGPSAFSRQWEYDWSELGADPKRLAGVTRCVHHDVVGLPPQGYRFDGVAELWFESMDAIAAAAAELIGIARAAEYLDRRNSVTVVTTPIMRWPAP